MPLNGLFEYHLQCFMGIYFHYIGLKYIMKSTCYSWNTYISVKSYQLNYITFFNSGNSSYHFKLMGCSSLPWPHRYRHKSQNELVTKVTTIHFTPERSSPPVIYASFGLNELTRQIINPQVLRMGAWAKLMPFCRRHTQLHLLKKIAHFDKKRIP